MAIGGYGLAFLAFLVSREPSHSVIGPWPPLSIKIAGVFAALALGCAALALVVHRHPWLSDSQWFENEDDVLHDEDNLKRCHVLAMHRVNSELDKSNDRKAALFFGDQC